VGWLSPAPWPWCTTVRSTRMSCERPAGSVCCRCAFMLLISTWPAKAERAGAPVVGSFLCKCPVFCILLQPVPARSALWLCLATGCSTGPTVCMLNVCQYAECGQGWAFRSRVVSQGSRQGPCTLCSLCSHCVSEGYVGVPVAVGRIEACWGFLGRPEGRKGRVCGS
jgi:hypothetical protein